MAPPSIRLINLVEVLKEELEDSGKQLPTDLTDEQLQRMTETEVRLYYQQHEQPAGALQPLAAHADAPREMLSSDEQWQTLQSKFPPLDDTPSFKAWFPALFTSRGQQLRPAQPTAVVLCFHSSGNAEDMFTSEGTGSRRVQSALLDACRAHNWLLLAPQLPGRAQRIKDMPLGSLQDVAQQLLPLVAPAVLAAGGRFGIVAHSLGCWTAFEMMLAFRQAGLPDPAVVCLSAMPWPHIPLEQRPWRQQRSLAEEEFKEECRGWDINETVFSPGMWELYQPLLRADFSLFDEYQPSVSAAEAAAAPFQSRLCLFWGQHDRRVTKEMVQEWRLCTKAPDVCIKCIPGNHLWPVSDPAAKTGWLEDVAAALQGALR